MNPNAPDDRPTAGDAAQARPREPQPWHAADEKPAARTQGSGAPVGTHSFTGSSANVGMPAAPRADADPERSAPREEGAAAGPDPLLEPRANIGEILGNKPSKG